jgi:glutathione S-transferase
MPLEKHDPFNSLLPKVGTVERAKYFKYMFYASSTIDHLLMETYKELYVKDSPDATLVNANKLQWSNFVVPELEADLQQHKYITGNKFTAGIPLYIQQQ